MLLFDSGVDLAAQFVELAGAVGDLDAESATRASLASQFNELRSQVDALAYDSSYNGVKSAALVLEQVDAVVARVVGKGVDLAAQFVELAGETCAGRAFRRRDRRLRQRTSSASGPCSSIEVKPCVAAAVRKTFTD